MRRDTIHKPLETPKHSSQLSADFAAFNILQPHILAQKLSAGFRLHECNQPAHLSWFPGPYVLLCTLMIAGLPRKTSIWSYLAMTLFFCSCFPATPSHPGCLKVESLSLRTDTHGEQFVPLQWSQVKMWFLSPKCSKLSCTAGPRTSEDLAAHE